MSYCGVSSARATHQIVRSCCATPICSPCGSVGYSATTYMPCCEGVVPAGDNTFLTINDLACTDLSVGISGASYVGVSGLLGNLTSIGFNAAICGPLNVAVIGVTGTAGNYTTFGTPVTIGTLGVGGAFTSTSPAPTRVGLTAVVLDNNVADACAVVTLT